MQMGDKWGVIDKQGKFVIKPQFDDFSSFGDGLSKVQVGDKWGVIDKSGQFVINPQFDSIWDVSEGLVPVEVDGRWGYIVFENKENQ